MRRTAGRETWHRLLEWDRGPTDSERLTSRILLTQGFDSVDPSHPLGGKDGGKDITCQVEGESCVVSVYFPRGQKVFGEVLTKFKNDYDKTASGDTKGFVFFTNQELTLSERSQLEDYASGRWVEIFHLERIASLLDSPNGYGLRLEFLQIEMTKEEQVSFINNRDQILSEIRNAVVRKPTQAVKGEHQIKTVMVEGGDYFGMVNSLYGPKLVECKKCEEVFRAAINPMLYGHSSELRAVTCPNCGHTQRFQ